MPPRPTGATTAKVAGERCRRAASDPAATGRRPSSSECGAASARSIRSTVGGERHVAAAGRSTSDGALGRRPGQRRLEDLPRTLELVGGRDGRGSRVRSRSSRCALPCIADGRACQYHASGALVAEIPRRRRSPAGCADGATATTSPRPAVRRRAPAAAATRRPSASAGTPRSHARAQRRRQRALSAADRRRANVLSGSRPLLGHRRPDDAPHPHRSCARPGRRTSAVASSGACRSRTSTAGAAAASSEELLDLDTQLSALASPIRGRPASSSCASSAACARRTSPRCCGVSVITVKRDWKAARAWLRRRLQ